MKYQKAWSLRRRANTRNVSFQDSFYGCQFTLSTQFIKPNHIAILLVQHLQSPTKRSQHFSTAYRNIVESNMLRAFRHPVATCCDRLGVENRTSAHYRVQHCCTNLSKRNRHQAASTNIAWKFWPFFKFEPTFRNRVVKRAQHVAPNNVAICCVEMLRSFSRGFKIALLLGPACCARLATLLRHAASRLRAVSLLLENP